MRTALWLAMTFIVPGAAFAADGLAFIDTSFENASPVWYETAPDGAILVHLLYDHERSSPNRAAGHIHLRLQAAPGARLTLEFTNLDNIWNGVPASVAGELKAVVVSENGLDWTPMATEALPANRVRLSVEMRGPELYVARLEPYRLSDLDRLLSSLRRSPLVDITPIGRTVQGRELEILRVGDRAAPYRVFIRARAHPWESGGNWVVEGLIQRLLKGDAEAEKFLRRYCVYILPMANKDGVARGMTRFNVQGKDLNRNWDKPADPELAPENAALERWLEGMIEAGQRPHLALELHNDGGGNLHVSRPARAGTGTTPRAHGDARRTAPPAHLVHRGQHPAFVPQLRHARRRLAGTLRHRRRGPRVQLQLDRRPEGLPVRPALEELRRKPRAGVLRLLWRHHAMTSEGREAWAH